VIEEAARNYTPPDASLAAYRELHHTLGVTRGVLIQPSVYGFDNRCMTDALKQLGPII
jgi:predicted TIM-barrel fold metal-dependent hydrolase